MKALRMYCTILCFAYVEPLKASMGTVGAHIPVSQRNKRVYEVIDKNLCPKDFKLSLRAAGKPTQDSCCLQSCVFPTTRIMQTMLKIIKIIKFPSQINDQISVWMMTAVGFK